LIHFYKRAFDLLFGSQSIQSSKNICDVIL